MAIYLILLLPFCNSPYLDVAYGQLGFRGVSMHFTPVDGFLVQGSFPTLWYVLWPSEKSGLLNRTELRPENISENVSPVPGSKANKIKDGVLEMPSQNCSCLCQGYQGTWCLRNSHNQVVVAICRDAPPEPLNGAKWMFRYFVKLI